MEGRNRSGRNVLQDTLVLLELEVVLTVDVGEALLAGDGLVADRTESVLDDTGVLVLRTDGEDDLANVCTSSGGRKACPEHDAWQSID